jgi:cytochrome b
MNDSTATVRETTVSYPAANPAVYAITRYKNSRHWAIHDPNGALVCVALYKKGASEVARRLNATTGEGIAGKEQTS